MSQLVHPGTDRYSMAELMAVILARMAAGDGESAGGGGANQVISLAANRLAQVTAAPNLWLFTGGAGVYNGKFDTMPIGTWDSRCGYGAECKIPITDIADAGTKGANPRAPTRVVRSGAGGLGGLQVDKYGNINLLGIGGPYPNLKVRGPGSVGTLWLGAAQTNVFLEHHNKRLFVEKVDYVTGAGWLTGGDSRHKTLNGRDGPRYVWTPIAVCDFTEDEHRMRLATVHPGYTVADVVANTGFELVIPPKVPTTTPPTDWELNELRTKVDRSGVLKRRRLTVG
jgi:glutaconate CoA-transferase, subunit B